MSSGEACIFMEVVTIKKMFSYCEPTYGTDNVTISIVAGWMLIGWVLIGWHHTIA